MQTNYCKKKKKIDASVLYDTPIDLKNCNDATITDLPKPIAIAVSNSLIVCFHDKSALVS